MMRRDLESAREKWIKEGKTDVDKEARAATDYLTYCNNDGLFADFHSNRHLFITSLERANLSPKMAQTLARHSDVRLTLGVYTHVGLHDQTAAIQSLPAPPESSVGPKSDAMVLRATGTDGTESRAPADDNGPKMVPILVPCGAENGAERPALEELAIASNCTEDDEQQCDNSDSTVDLTAPQCKTFRTEQQPSASHRTKLRTRNKKVSPRGFEPLTFGSGGRRHVDATNKEDNDLGEPPRSEVPPLVPCLPDGQAASQRARLSRTDLLRLVDACRDLPPAIKVAIRALIKTVE